MVNLLYSSVESIKIGQFTTKQMYNHCFQKQQKFSAQRGTPSLELSEDDPDYMSFPQLRGLKCQLDSIDHSQKPDVPKRSSSGKYPQENQGRYSIQVILFYLCGSRLNIYNIIWPPRKKNQY